MNHLTELNTPETVANPIGGRPMNDSVNARDLLAAELEALRGRVVELESALSVCAVKRDVTEHLQLSNQLIQAQKMEAMGTLAGEVAHDFNNLLTVIRGFSELLLAGKKTDDPEYEDLQKIFHSAASGAELVQRLLTFSRKVEPKPVPLNLNGQIIEVEKLLRRTIPKMIDIQMDLSADPAEINADPCQIEQVLMNLVVNARDAMPDGGKLVLQTRNITAGDGRCKVHDEAYPGRHVLLTVSDTGQGMDKNTLGRIFEPFYTTKEIGQGTGLGLAIVDGIVRHHGGDITCESVVGHGTTFNVCFPAIEAPVHSGAGKSRTVNASGMETILLIDDEEFVRDLGERILTRAGYTVLSAANGLEGLDLFRKKRRQISLVILDLIMPRMGGEECLKEMVEIDPKVKVLVSSGYPADSSLKDSFQLAARGFANKPFEMKELLRQVREVLDSK
jgi:two-component system, cell cycle sensor histidine kinase and response regulator CckA